MNRNVLKFNFNIDQNFITLLPIHLYSSGLKLICKYINYFANSWTKTKTRVVLAKWDIIFRFLESEIISDNIKSFTSQSCEIPTLSNIRIMTAIDQIIRIKINIPIVFGSFQLLNTLNQSWLLYFNFSVIVVMQRWIQNTRCMTKLHDYCVDFCLVYHINTRSYAIKWSGLFQTLLFQPGTTFEK